MKIEFDTKKYVKDLAKSKSYFHTFLNRKNIAVGILRLGPGEEDTQAPHHSDEVYYIVRGNGFLNVGEKVYVISEGMSYFVAKNIEHKFHGNTEELVVVYFFSGQDS
ncbi:MAG: cupin domain-containing protein [Thaumarchaeota archaeon]|nr:cupin domain-containing protein [Nitrososphaerota archaeon]